MTQVDPPFEAEWVNTACLRRHGRLAAACAAEASSQAPPPPPPPLQLEQCCDQLCSAGYQVCRVCETRVIPWTVGAPASTQLAEHTVQLVDRLNCLPSNLLPLEFICGVTEESLRNLGGHDPQAGRGDDREADATNKAGSSLMLAALLPRVYGIETAGPLRIFGVPPPNCLTTISSTRARSGKGPDNRRMNAWEALLNHWQDIPSMENLRDLLLQTLVEMNLAIELQVDPDYAKLVWQMPRPALQCSVTLPIGHRERGLFGGMA